MDGRLGAPAWRQVTRRRLLGYGATAGLAAAQIQASRMSRAEQPGDPSVRRALAIALPDFGAASSELADVAHQIPQLVADDLKNSGSFTSIDPSAGGGVDVDAAPQFGVWRSLNAEFLIIGRVKAVGERLQSEFRLWDVVAGQMLIGAQYFSQPDEWRRVGHVVSATVYERLLGVKRDFEPPRD
jgi:TolB protein